MRSFARRVERATAAETVGIYSGTVQNHFDPRTSVTANK
jgi:hypothetical protein